MLLPRTSTNSTKTAFIYRLKDSTYHPYKKQKKDHISNSASEMALFAHASTQFLNPPAAPSRKRSQRFFRDDIDDFLSSDLEHSFASNVSLNSPPQNPLALTPDKDYAEPMDISPMPLPKPSNENIKSHSRPRAFTSAARLFGNDLSNNKTSQPSPNLQVPNAQISGSTQSSTKRIQRSALPMEWFVAPHAPESSIIPPPPVPVSPVDEPMDIDTSYVVDMAPAAISFSPVPQSAAPTITGFNALFYDTMSPRRSLDSPRGPLPKKRRSLSPESSRYMEHDNMSSPIIESPSQSKLERLSSGPLLSKLGSQKPTLSGLGAPSSSFLKRPRRPVFSVMANPSDGGIKSAYPILSSQDSQDDSPRGAPPVRRAFSALLPPTINIEQSDESSFDGPDMSSPAQAYCKRQQVKTIRRCDGTEDFRPLTGATAMVLRESPSAKFMAAGLPGFGDNEAHGKILPCRRVTEDGLMRINCQTLDDLLDGKYDAQITEYHIVDCRFDYEYNGGHIPGAVNINTPTAVEEFLLASALSKPKPSVSGDQARKTILVFHCEFSAKRAPTFAKHLRARDRAMNNHVYPKIHYPEVYILDGGYCQYFKTSAFRCQPAAYVTMDDPIHAKSRREDLDQFRRTKFGRHRSYAYGDGAGKTSLASQQQQQTKRNTVPSAPPSLFAAANAARTRRGGSALQTLPEDGNSTAEADDTDTDIGDSPCPPPTKNNMFNGKKLARASLIRAETYGPARMPY